jgi:ATP-dependent exoDNAse (exonuclease V) beta subunit
VVNSNFKLYNASAGSGKTFTLVKNYLKLLMQSDSDYKFRQILAITFTNKAVNEMKNRVLKSLSEFSEEQILTQPNDLFKMVISETGLTPKTIHDKSKRVLNAILNNYAAFEISTIDGFTHRIIRTFARDLNIPQNFDIDLNTDALLGRAVDTLIAQAGSDNTITNYLIDYALEKTDDDKSWDISKDLFEVAKLLLNENHAPYVEALQDKTLHDFSDFKRAVQKQHNIIQNKIKTIADVILKLIADNSVEHNDFSGSNGYVPSYFVKLSNENFNIDFGRAWMAKITDKPLYPQKTKAEIKALIDAIQPQIASAFVETEQLVIRLGFLKNILKNITPLSLLYLINQSLQQIKEEDNIMLISEFNAIIEKELKDQPVPFIYERIGERYKHYFIDEFQDTSQKQWDNLKPLLNNAISSEDANNQKGSLMLVGDAKQAIYRWRGGLPEQFIDLYTQKDQPFAIAQSIENLPTNFRSSQAIISFNNQFFKHLAGIGFANPDYAKVYQASTQNLNSNHEGYVDLQFLDIENKDEDYPQAVKDTIQKAQAYGYKLSDICILVRKGKEAQAIADVLDEEGIPMISSDTLKINRSPKVQFMVNVMQLSLQPDNQELKVLVLDYLADMEGVTDKHDYFKIHLSTDTSTFFETRHFLIDKFLQMPLYESVEYLIRSFNLNDTPSAYVQFFMDAIYDFSNNNNGGLSGFIEFWEQQKHKLNIVSPEGQDAVQMMTIHKAKGLEFPVVIFPYADLDIYKENTPMTWYNLSDDKLEGLDCVYLNLNKSFETTSEQGATLYSDRQNQLELDNINLLYVTLTRPVEQLYIIGNNAAIKNGVANHKNYSGLLIDFLQSIGKWSDSQTHYTFGNPIKKAKKQKQQDYEVIELSHFTSTDISALNLKIATSASYLWDTNRKEAIEKGNLIHKLMSDIYTIDDFEPILNRNLQQGLIDLTQYEFLKPLIHQLIHHPQLYQYFQKGLTIYNERDILCEDGRLLRPDRLVINQKQVTIIDYKTGLADDSHHQQLEAYASVLESIDYSVQKKLLVYINDSIDIKEV